MSFGLRRGAREATEELDSGGMQRSYLGFRGTEDLGGGLRADLRLGLAARHRNRHDDDADDRRDHADEAQPAPSKGPASL